MKSEIVDGLKQKVDAVIEKAKDIAPKLGEPILDIAHLFHEVLDELKAKVVPEETEAEPKTPQVPTVGRIVNYVMKDGSARPFLITNGGDMSPNGKLFYDSTNDQGNFPDGKEEPVNIGDGVEQLWSVAYSVEKTPGTWHWPIKA